MRTIFASLVIGVLFASPASAVLLVGQADLFSSGGYPTSSTDLIEGLVPTGVIGTADSEGIGSDPSGGILTNGLIANGGVAMPDGDMTLIHSGAQLIFTLPAMPNGYDITTFTSYSAWRDVGRLNQDYTILYTTTTNASFALLTSVSWLPNVNANATRVAASDVNLTNVTAIRFDFPAQQNGYVGYREIDVTGSASATPVLPGDYNNNGVVDAADYILWRENNNTATTLVNDSTPGTSQIDYAVWRKNFGRTAGIGAGASANSAVPEPATLLMLIVAAAGCYLQRSRAA